jgi:transposase
MIQEEYTMPTALHCGIDVSLATLTVALIADDDPQPQLKEFANTPAGHRRLLRWLAQCGATVHACLEPTSSYHLALCRALQQAAHCTVAVVNPRALRHFALGRLQRAKTDRCDALVLAQYGKVLAPPCWQPPRAVELELRSIARHLASLSKRRTALKNQLHSARHAQAARVVLGDLRAELRALEARQAKLQQAALALVAADRLLSRRYELLLSVKGIGAVTALRLLAELSPLPRELAKNQWVAAAGLDPMPRESGASLKGRRRLSKQGNAHLRRALFIPALVAVRYCGPVREYYEKLQRRTASKLAALCAVMRKLLQAIWGMFQTNTPFNASQFCQPTR